MTSVWFTITENNLHEGGRPRDPREVYLNLNKEQAAVLPADPFPVRGDTGQWMVWHATGHAGGASHSRHPKNLRSVGALGMGTWLLPKGAAVGDRVQLTDAGNGSFDARYLPQERHV